MIKLQRSHYEMKQNNLQHAQAKMAGPKTTLKVSNGSYFLNGFFMECSPKCLRFKGITIEFITYLTIK